MRASEINKDGDLSKRLLDHLFLTFLVHMAIPGAFLTSRWRKEIGLRYFKAENECLARAFALVSRKIFPSHRKKIYGSMK